MKYHFKADAMDESMYNYFITSINNLIIVTSSTETINNMTKAAIPSTDMEPTSQLPAYMSDTNLSTHSEETLDEKPRATSCCTAQATPHIDAQMRNPNMRAHMLTLSAALASAANDDTCAKCSLDNVAQSMTAFMKDVRAAKEHGGWSREEKKALKSEAKILAKGMKKDARKMWKTK